MADDFEVCSCGDVRAAHSLPSRMGPQCALCSCGNFRGTEYRAMLLAAIDEQDERERAAERAAGDRGEDQ